MSVARFIADQRTNYRVPHTITCVLLGVSLAWFYKWLDRPPTPRQRRRAELDAAVRGHVRRREGVARLAPAARRPARCRLDRDREDGGGLDAPARSDRPEDQAEKGIDQAGQDGAERSRTW